MQDPNALSDRNPHADSGAPRRSRRGIIVAAVVVLVIAAGSGFVAMIGGVMKSSQAYTDAMALASADCRVAEALGSPIEAGFFVSGSVETSGPAGHAELSIPVEGPTASGTIFVVSSRSAGVWSTQMLQLELDDASRIDLLSPSGCAPAPGGATAPGSAPAAVKGSAAIPEATPVAAQPADPEPGAVAPAQTGGKELVPGGAGPAGGKP